MNGHMTHADLVNLIEDMRRAFGIDPGTMTRVSREQFISMVIELSHVRCAAAIATNPVDTELTVTQIRQIVALSVSLVIDELHISAHEDR